MPGPLVSVIVPSFNQGRYIRETIDSILAQDYRPLELLVMDGASIDETVGILQAYSHVAEMRWWSEPDQGVVDAVNKGLSRATGSIIGVQSSDDVYVPGAIAAVVRIFGRTPKPGLVYGDVEYIDRESHPVGRTALPRFDLGEYVGKRFYIPQASAFVSREAMQTVGGWRPDFSYAADADFFLRIATLCEVVRLDRVLGRYRYHEAQREREGARIAADWERAVDEWIRRANPRRGLRRKARSGVHLTRAHYLPEAQWARVTMELYRAVLITPSIAWHPSFPARELLPGRRPIWKTLSRIKRMLGVRPRS